MSGTKAGARKARDKNLQNNPNFYADIGSKSWDNPDRNRKTGFAQMTPELRAELGRIGGKKTKAEYQTFVKETKNDYHKKEAEFVTAEEIHAILEQSEEDGPISS